MRLALFLASAVLSAAQIIPNHYIVQLETDPAVAVSIAGNVRFSAADGAVAARRIQIRDEHAQAEQAILGLGGTVTRHFDTIVNAMAVTLTENGAAQLRQRTGVKGVYPVNRHHLLMDQAIAVHRFTQAWQSLPGGAASAGAGIKIGILDSGIDNTHPAFQGFTTATPAGFPILSGVAVAADTNSKVIVARVYSDVPYVDNTQSDGNDYYGHGTTVAGIAAGLSTNPGFPGIGAISGVAPGAWIGNYKVGDDYGDLDDVTFMAGLEDAFNDGMNVVNYSAGGSIENSTDESGPVPQAIANALAGGMVVVVAAGNSGPGVGTIGAPAASAGAIGVAAMENQRWFWYSVNLAGSSFLAILSDEEISYTSGDLIGTVVDVSTLTSDAGGYACSALPNNSLVNQIALIQRGGPGTAACSFASKLNNAQAAGAIGAIIYDNKADVMYDYSQTAYDTSAYELGLIAAPLDSNGNELIFTWDTGSATLPAVMVSQADGQTIKQLVQTNAGANADIDFDGKTPLPYPPNIVADFSSAGPTPGGNIKPDIVAVGDSLVAPETTQWDVSDGCPTPYALDLNVGCYQPYTFIDSPFEWDFLYGYGYGQYFDDGSGTSFATPMVTGSVAVLMGALPGLTGPQYRSLVTNGAAEFDQYPANNIAGPQLAGAGRLDLLGSLQAGLASVPSSLNFLPPVSTTSGGGTTNSSAVPSVRAFRASSLRTQDASSAAAGVSEQFVLTNTGASSDTFTITVQSIDGIALPALDNPSFPLKPGASQTVTATIPGATQLPSGQYHGFLVINGTQGQTPLRVPYWYGVAGTSAQNISILYDPGYDPSSCTDYIDFRLMDAIGLPFEPVANPAVTTADARAQVVSVYPIGDISGTFEAEIVTGRPDVNGNNVFTISVGNTTFPAVTIGIDNSGQTACGGGSAMGTNSARPVSVRREALKNKGRMKARTPSRAGEDR